MIDKRAKSATQAVAGIHDGAVIMLGGFGEAGSPTELIHALVDHGAARGVIEHDEAVAAAADGAQPIALGMIEETVDDAVLACEFQGALAACPVEDFDARRPLQGIDVIDLADAAHGQDPPDDP